MNLEKYLKEIGENSLALGMLHKSSENKYSNKAMRIDIPVIILSTITGSAVLWILVLIVVRVGHESEMVGLFYLILQIKV